jgi:hypothetical protein
MTDIFTTLKRLQRLSRPHRIRHLRVLVKDEPPRSIRRAELESALKREVTAQIRKESKSAA